MSGDATLDKAETAAVTKVYCINDLCGIRSACQIYKTYIQLDEDERKFAVHYWPDSKGECEHWVLRDKLRDDAGILRNKAKLHEQFGAPTRGKFNPRTKRYRQKGGYWDGQ